MVVAPLTVNFMCQPNWAMRCLDIRSDILGSSQKLFLDEINIRMARLSQADCSLYSGWAASNQVKA